jgi:type II secretory pathway component PulF
LHEATVAASRASRGGGGRWEAAVTDGILRFLEEGKSLADALAALSFPPLFVALVGVGETNGDLVASLDRLERYYTQKAESARERKRALVYPGVVGVMITATAVMISAWVIPQFQLMYAAFDHHLPALTQVLLAANTYLLSHWQGWSAAFAVMVLTGWLSLRLMPSGVWMRQCVRIPVLRLLIRYWSSHRFAQFFGLLVGGGLSALDAVQTVCRLPVHPVLLSVFLSVREQLREGKPISEALEKIPVIDPFLPSVLIIGEKSGTIAESLETAETFYQRELDRRIHDGLKMIEPALLIAAGGAVGLLLVALFLPLSHLVGDISQWK